MCPHRSYQDTLCNINWAVRVPFQQGDCQPGLTDERRESAWANSCKNGNSSHYCWFGQRRLVANQMGHSSKTADEYYTSLGDDDKRVQAYQVMGTMRRKALRIESSTDEEEEEPEEPVKKKAKRCKYATDEEERIEHILWRRKEQPLMIQEGFWRAIPISTGLLNRSKIK